MEITLYRAAKDDYISDTCSFAETREIAELYRSNPGFGGATLYSAEISVDDAAVLEATGWSLEQLEERAGARATCGNVDVDVAICRCPVLADALRAQGIQWVIVSESYPADSRTWTYIGGSEHEPELIEIC